MTAGPSCRPVRPAGAGRGRGVPRVRARNAGSRQRADGGAGPPRCHRIVRRGQAGRRRRPGRGRPRRGAVRRPDRAGRGPVGVGTGARAGRADGDQPRPRPHLGHLVHRADRDREGVRRGDPAGGLRHQPCGRALAAAPGPVLAAIGRRSAVSAARPRPGRVIQPAGDWLSAAGWAITECAVYAGLAASAGLGRDGRAARSPGSPPSATAWAASGTWPSRPWLCWPSARWPVFATSGRPRSTAAGPASRARPDGGGRTGPPAARRRTGRPARSSPAGSGAAGGLPRTDRLGSARHRLPAHRADHRPPGRGGVRPPGTVRPSRPTRDRSAWRRRLAPSGC